MLMGEFSHTLDDKGRIVIPSRFRDDLLQRFVITKGLDGCLFLYPSEEWGHLVEKLHQLPMTNPNARSFMRLFMAGAHEVEVDKQYRVTLPPKLREYAAIEKEAILIGVSGRAELWSAQRWAQYQAGAQDDFETIAEKMVELGL